MQQCEEMGMRERRIAQLVRCLRSQHKLVGLEQSSSPVDIQRLVCTKQEIKSNHYYIKKILEFLYFNIKYQVIDTLGDCVGTRLLHSSGIKSNHKETSYTAHPDQDAVFSTSQRRRELQAPCQLRSPTPHLRIMNTVS